MDYAEQLIHQEEPYHFQRWRSSMHSNYPRPPQPNTFQPNQKVGVYSSSSRDYWKGVLTEYLDRKKISVMRR